VNGEASRASGLRQILGRAAPGLILVAALALHLVLMPAPGFEGDIAYWDTWMRVGVVHGVAHLDENTWCNYPPGFLYVLKGLGAIWQATFGDLPPAGSLTARLLLKSTAVLGDLVGAWVLFLLARRQMPTRWALAVLAAYACNPAMVFNSAVWGQIDSIVGLLALLAAWAVARGRTAEGFAVLAVACLFKFQAVILAPVLLVAGWVREGGWALRRAFFAAAATAGVFLWPYAWAGRLAAVAANVGSSVDLYPMISMNAFNIWWLVGGNRSPYISDRLRIGNALLTYQGLGLILFAVAVVMILVRLWDSLRREPGDGAGEILLACALITFAFYLLPTQMHERYLVPAVTLLAAAAIFSRRVAWAYGVVSIAVFVSLGSALKLLFPGGFGVLGRVLDQFGLFDRLWPASRREGGILAVLLLAVFLILLVGGARRRLVWGGTAAGLVALLVVIVTRLPLSGTVQLSRWQPVQRFQSWGTLHQDANVQGGRLEIEGFIFRRGIGTHAVSLLTYDLNGAFRQFESCYGIDAGYWGNRARFLVLGEYATPAGRQTRPLFDSGIVIGSGYPGYLRVSLEGVQALTLQVLDGGDGINFDHVAWLAPTLIR
jgi:Gpi18-like mannosyltransferase